MIDWNETFPLEKDADGVWIYIKDEYLDKDLEGRLYGRDNLHEPMSNINWYLRQLHSEIQENGKTSIDW